MSELSQKSEQVEIVRDIVDEASLEQQRALLDWAKELITIRHSDASTVARSKAAVAATARRRIVWPIVRVVLRRLKRLGWDERSWSSRFGIGAAATTVAVWGGQGAGIAALGTAIGVPLWIVFGAGGAFAGLLVDELEKAIKKSRDRNAHAPTEETTTDEDNS